MGHFRVRAFRLWLLRVQRLGFRVQDLGFKCLGFRKFLQDLGFRVRTWGLGFRFQEGFTGFRGSMSPRRYNAKPRSHLDQDYGNASLYLLHVQGVRYRKGLCKSFLQLANRGKTESSSGLPSQSLMAR